MLTEALEAPSVYDEFLRYLARHGYEVPVELLQRDVTLPHAFNADLVPMFVGIYDDPEKHWAAYETCEELVDLEENFQLWRFRHLKTVRADHRLQARHRRLQRRRVPQGRPRPDLLPRAVRRPHRDRWLTRQRL